MEDAGQHLFAGAGGSHEQGGDVGRRNTLGQRQQVAASRIDEDGAAGSGRAG